MQAFGGQSKSSSGDGANTEKTKAMNTMWGALKYTYKTEGKWGLFPPYAPGWIPKLVDAGAFNFIFWFWFTVCSSVAARIGDSVLIDTVKGIVAAVINRVCCAGNIPRSAACSTPSPLPSATPPHRVPDRACPPRVPQLCTHPFENIAQVSDPHTPPAPSLPQRRLTYRPDKTRTVDHATAYPDAPPWPAHGGLLWSRSQHLQGLLATCPVLSCPS